MTILETLTERLRKYGTVIETDNPMYADPIEFMQGRIEELREIIQLLFPAAVLAEIPDAEEIVRHYMDDEDVVKPPPAELMDPIIAEYSKLLSDGQRISLAKATMKLLSDEQRFSVISYYCRGCGSPNSPCYCNVDE